MTDDLRIFLSTIYGEAAMSSVHAWRAIASVILNRVGVREWHKLATPLEVVTAGGFDAYTAQNVPYKGMWRATSKPDYLIQPNSPLNRLRSAVLPLYEKREPVTTDAVLYYSPKAQAALHAKRPGIWRALPAWNFDLLDRVEVAGTEQDDFAWFRYKVAQ